MPAKGTISKYLPPHRVVTSPLHKRYVKKTEGKMTKPEFLFVATTMTEVIRDYIENDMEGVKLPYFGLIISYRTRVTQKLKERYINRAPEKRSQLVFKPYFGKIAWVRFRVSRFPFSKAYSFVPYRETLRSVKENANKRHAYFSCTNIKAVHQHGKMLLSLDDSLTKNLSKNLYKTN